MDIFIIIQIIICAFVLLYFLNLIFIRTSDTLKQLPGPTCLPLVGHVQILFKKEPYRYLSELGRKYGEIYQIQIGYRNVVILNSSSAIREAFSDWSFSGRPSFESFRAIKRLAPRFAFTTFGPEWKFLRKNATKALALFATSKNSRLQNVVETAAESFQADIEKHLNEPFDPKQAVVECVAGVIGAVNFGLQFDRTDPLLKVFIKSAEVFAGFIQFGSFLDYFPLGAFFMSRAIDRFIQGRKPVIDIVRNHLRRHTYSDDVTDVADALHRKSSEATEGDLFNAGVTKERIQDLASDLFGAAFGTTMETFHWCLALVAKYPKVQQKMADELRLRIEPGRCPVITDACKTPYTEAALLEVFRFSSLNPLGVSHSSVGNVSFKGYKIPKDAVVISNLWNVHYDENVFPDPYDFQPERFLSKDGSLSMDMAQNILPFSAGKRRCPGENLARQELYLLLSATVNKFIISEVDGETIDVHNAVVGFSRRVKDYRLVFSYRKDVKSE